MVRSELVDSLSRDNPSLSLQEVENIVSLFFEEIVAKLSAEGRVELRGFGAFSTRAREARIGRNPASGQPVAVCATRLPYFKPGKEIRQRLNV